MEVGKGILPNKDQDACFWSSSWLGVADGVGGWLERGIDSGPFARELMDHSRALAERDPLAPPKRIIADAVAECKELGSSTIILLRYDSTSGTLHAANLGDSGFLVIRGREVVAASRPMQENSAPFQVGATAGQFDDPGKAEEYEVPVMDGDIVIVSTDGLTDFLFKEEIAREVNKSLVLRGESLDECASKLAAKARGRMERSTPFFCAVPENVNIDDITILIARVQTPPSSKLDKIDSCPSLERLSLSSAADALMDGACHLPMAEAHSHDALLRADDAHADSWIGVATEPCGGYPASLTHLCGKFSPRLMQNCGNLLSRSREPVKPREVLIKAARKTREKIAKSSTALIAALDRPTGLLSIAWVGDSRLLVLRGRDLVAATSPSRSSPVEADDPDEESHPFDEPLVITAAGFPGDDPESVVQTLEVEVRPGDVILLGTRGIFESLFDDKIVKIVRKELDGGASMKAVAGRLVERARRAMDGATPRIKALASNTISRVVRAADITAVVATV